MIDRKAIPDAQQRAQVLDPAQSFIVQAPAGSGKTTLLIQRYLRLLSCVDAPEEIVAITFTRKAAAEMRTRVLNALADADRPESTAETVHASLNRDLSLAVLRRNEQANWHIAENPQRLRIQTIDSLCAALTQQMPVLSTFGAQPDIIEDASELYLEAVRATLALIDREDHDIAVDIERLFEHLDNDRGRIESLLTEMLAKRDHWLRHLRAPRQELEESLQHSRHDAVQFVYGLLPSALHEELLALLHYAAVNLTEAGISSSITSCTELTSLAIADVEHWQSVAELLLTKSGDWRKKFTVREGFPSGNSASEKEQAKDWKNRLETLIRLLAVENTVRQALQDIRALPPPHYANAQWEILAVITRLLPYAVAQLNVVFQAHGKVDFSEVTQRALQALGDADAPTDLALALDHRIKHIMIDEFQDTSISQYKLIEKLTAGWEVEDGRTLFVVGDPMQSIYRFREAEVGLFLQARNKGIGHVMLHPVTLSANFRSQQGIIDWVNSAFADIMPSHENVAMGAVAYAPSVAMHAALVDDAVKVYPCWGRNAEEEARQVVEIIHKARLNDSTGTIAILVRNRNHLIAITEHIFQDRMRFRAVDIELLHHKPVVQDLLALTRVLMNPSDQIAWFALLRAPWCGLLLSDLNALAESNPDLIKKEVTMWTLLNEEIRWHAISADARARLNRLKAILQPCMNHRQRQPLRGTVEAVWMALGGPGANIKKGNEGGDPVQDAQIFLDYLENYERAGIVHDPLHFEQGLSKLYAKPDLAADESLQIMTIHKAKGLEFDTVIVPGLGRAPRNNKKQLLRWMEQPTRTFSEKDGAKMDLLLAPIQEVGTASDSIYQWIEKLDQNKALFETDRLLYVAATRAKKFLHLLGHTDLSSDDEGRMTPSLPMAHSLLSRLWSNVAPIYHARAEFHPAKNNHVNNVDCAPQRQKNYCRYRLPTEWILPDAPSSVIWKKPSDLEHIQDEIEFSWATEMARHVGNVVHRWLERIAEDEMQNWTVMRLQTLRGQFKHNLLADGMIGADHEIESALDRIMTALTNAISDERGRWILSTQQHAQNELKITTTSINLVPTSWIIDRTFLDSSGVRWVIDYKIGSHEGSDIEAFLDREKIRYQRQLDHYAYIMQQLDSREVKRGIYFPLICGWREW